MKKIIKIVLILAAAGGIGFFVKNKLRNTDADAKDLTLYGNVDIRQVALGFRTSGRIDSMAFEEGDSVRTGELLAVLDKDHLEDSLALFKAQAAVGKANVSKLEAGSRPAEIEQAKALVEERQTALTNAQQTLDRQNKLATTGATSQQTAEDAKAVLDAAMARLGSSKQALALTEEGPRAEDIAIARAELEATQVKVTQAERLLEDAELKSPADGIILTRIQEPGAIVGVGATIYTLSLKAPIWVRSYISEPDLGRIHPGMEVEVFTDSRPDTSYRGQIGFISPVAEFTPKSVETEELRTDLVYRMRVIIKEPDDALRQGMPVTVHFPHQPKTNSPK